MPVQLLEGDQCENVTITNIVNVSLDYVTPMCPNTVFPDLDICPHHTGLKQ